MVRVVVALVLGMSLLMLPAGAAAHPAPGKRHAATDLAGVSVAKLERRVAKVARRLGRRPGTRARRATVAAVGAPNQVGEWSSVLPAPVVPIFSAVLSNGKVLIWDSVGDAPAESFDDHSFTRAAVYDPVTNTSKRVDVQGANIFCAGFVQLANGNVFVAGGNLDRNLAGIRQTHIFDWRTETWSRGPDMQDGRWYPSVASLPNDEAIIVGGGPTVAEVRTTSGGLRRLTGFTTSSSRSYPFMQTAPDGRALLMGPSTSLSLIDSNGIGAFAGFGTRDSISRSYGAYAPYDIGRFLVAGGGSVTEDGRSGVPTRTASVVDTRSGTVRVRATFDNRDGALIPGQYVKVRMGRGRTEQALLVSERAVGTDQDKRFVLLVGPDNRAAYREITLGGTAGGQRIVTSGLQPGERIVVNGLQRVRPGALVAPQPADTAAARSAPAA